MQPLIFLEAESAVRIGAHGYVPESDRFLFEPGHFAFQILCAIVIDQPAAEYSIFDPLVLIDGPPNPMIDDGFHLYRLSRDVTQRLAALPAHRIEGVIATWQQEFQRHPDLHGLHEQCELLLALIRLTSISRRSEIEGKSLFVEILNR